MHGNALTKEEQVWIAVHPMKKKALRDALAQEGDSIERLLLDAFERAYEEKVPEEERDFIAREIAREKTLEVYGNNLERCGYTVLTLDDGLDRSVMTLRLDLEPGQTLNTAKEVLFIARAVRDAIGQTDGMAFTQAGSRVTAFLDNAGRYGGRDLIDEDIGNMLVLMIPQNWRVAAIKLDLAAGRFSFYGPEDWRHFPLQAVVDAAAPTGRPEEMYAEASEFISAIDSLELPEHRLNEGGFVRDLLVDKSLDFLSNGSLYKGEAPDRLIEWCEALRDRTGALVHAGRRDYVYGAIVSCEYDPDSVNAPWDTPEAMRKELAQRAAALSRDPVMTAFPVYTGENTSFLETDEICVFLPKTTPDYDLGAALSAIDRHILSGMPGQENTTGLMEQSQ